MKQITKTAKIIAKLRKTVSADVDLDALAVFEASAFNTLPIRKKHFLYKGARADKFMLDDMVTELAKESRPVQIMHNGEMLPVGRVFHGEVLPLNKNDYEIRVLFFVDATGEQVRNIDLGIVDQVSVSVMSKKLICSACDFDYLGEGATSENFWTATCANDHSIGQKGVYAKMQGLSDWNELSLVNRGGAQNARIVSPDKAHFTGPAALRLAAHGIEPSMLILTATADMENTMDFAELSGQVVDLRVDVKLKEAEIATLTAKLGEATTKVTALEANLASAGNGAQALAAKDTEIAAAVAATAVEKTEKEAALSALKEVATALLVASGDTAPTVPETVAELSALITEKKAALAAVLIAGGRSKAADTPVVEQKRSLSAFKAR
jgi:hypothetical protein